MAKRLAIIPAILLIFLSVFAASLGLSDLYREEGSRVINDWYLLHDLDVLELEEMGPEAMESGMVFSRVEEIENFNPDLVQSEMAYSGGLDSELIEAQEGYTELASELETSDIAVYEESDLGLSDESQEAYYFDMEEVMPPLWSWEQAHRYLRLAHQLAPFDPTVLEELGRIHQYRVVQEAEGVPPSEPELGKSLAYYRQSLALRPAWPYGWMGIMLLKITENQFDEDFAVAMKRAAALGPWEPGIQMGIAEDGLAVRDRLPEELRKLVMDTVEKGLQRESQYIMAVAEQYGLIEPRLEVSDELENTAE